MRSWTGGLAAALLMMGSATPALAGDHNGADELSRGDYASAEAVLQKSLRVSPNDPELLLNLAAVYARTGRVSEAARLYHQVIARPDESMRTRDAAMSAHALAQAGLRRVSAVQLTSR